MQALLDGFDRFLRFERRLSPETVRAYVGDLRDLAQFAIERAVNEPQAWTTDLLRAHLAQCLGVDGAHAQASTRARKRSAYRAFFAWLRRQGVVTDDPAATLQSPKLPKPLPRAVDVDAVLALLTPATGKAALRDQAALVLLYGLGLRLSEATGLRDLDVDLEEKLVRVRGKGGKERIVPIPTGCVPVLAAYRNTRPPAPCLTFLVGRAGHGISSRTVARVVARLSHARLGRHVTPHQLRHSFATHVLSGGGGLRELQELLGHSHLSTTQRYTMVAIDRLFAIYDKAHPRSRGRST